MSRLLPFVSTALLAYALVAPAASAAEAPANAAASAPAEPATFEAARALFDSRKFGEAQQVFEKLAVSDPKNPEMNYYLGQLANRRNEPDRAVAFLNQAVAAAPTVGRYHHVLGDAYGRAAQKASVFSQLGLAKKCAAAYQRAAELEPGNLNFRLSLFEYYRQAPSLVGGGMDKAATEAAVIKKLDAHRGRIAFATLYVAEKKFDRALAEFDEVLQASADDYASLFQVGRLAAQTGQFPDRGLASLRRYLELSPPVTPNTPGPAAVQWHVGLILEKKSDPAGARAAYEAAVKLDPKFTPAAEALRKLAAKR